MSSVMFWRAMKDVRWTLAWYAFGLLVYSVLIISIYPMFKDMMSTFENLLDQYPEAVLVAFGLQGDLATFQTFIGVEFINVIWPLIVAIFVIMAGTATVAQEIERGTADLWLSVPEDRWRLLGSKVVVLVLGIVILVAVTVISLGVGAAIVDAHLGFSALIAASLVMICYPFAILGYSVLLSSLFSERGKAAGIAAGITILSYLSWLVGGLVDQWSWLKYISPFTAYKPQFALDHGQVPVLEVLVLLALGLAGVAAALVIFQRRDVATT
jgi:ABC-2 type transport system permease protein